MSSSLPAQAAFYRPAEVARLLHCSEWWVKEQARRRRIPFTWIGGRYLFTAEHVAEIVQRFEVRPVDTVSTVVTAARASRRSVMEDGEPTVRLTARLPRRVRAASNPAA